MPEFVVTLCRTVPEYADVTIIADTADEAEIQAKALAQAGRVSAWESIQTNNGPEYDTLIALNIQP